MTPFRAARAVSMSALQRAIGRADTWERCELGDVITPWRQFAGGRAPRTIESTGARPSRDTAENQADRRRRSRRISTPIGITDSTITIATTMCT